MIGTRKNDAETEHKYDIVTEQVVENEIEVDTSVIEDTSNKKKSFGKFKKFIKEGCKLCGESLAQSRLKGIKFAIAFFTAFVTFTFKKIKKYIYASLKHNHVLLIRTSKFVIPICVFLLAAYLVYSTSFYAVAIKVTVGDSVMGYVENQYDYSSTVMNVENAIAAETGDEFIFKKVPTYSYAFIKKSRITTREKLYDNVMSNAKTNLDQCYALVVDGKLVGTYPKEGPLLDLLESIKEPYQSTDGSEKVEFSNDVQIVKGFFSRLETQTIDEIKAKLTGPSEKKYYTVVENDNISKIAKKVGLSKTKLRAINPDIDLDDIKVDDKINISLPEVDLGVKNIKTVTYTVEIPFETKTTKTEELFEGTTKITKAGVKGENEITAEVTYINGVETDRKIQKTVNISRPGTQLTLTGTKPIAPSGTFIWPVPGHYKVSSGYGRRWGSFHPALDFPAPKGTTVVASDAGTVITAGWVTGGLGNCIVINHGNGVTTRYGHLNSISVSVGQKVHQGQTIGGVGTTGNSTGYHMHFEISVNGSTVNPYNYLK